MGVAPQFQPARLAHRIDIPEGRVPAHAVDDVDRLDPGSGTTVQLAEIVRDRHSRRRRRRQERALERLYLVVRIPSNPHPPGDTLEQRAQRGRRPLRCAQRLGQSVVVAGPSDGLRASVV